MLEEVWKIEASFIAVPKYKAVVVINLDTFIYMPPNAVVFYIHIEGFCVTTTHGSETQGLHRCFNPLLKTLELENNIIWVGSDARSDRHVFDDNLLAINISTTISS